MDSIMKKACAEAYDIIYHMEGALIDCIPDEFLDMLEKEMDQNYDFYINYQLGINQQELLPETRAILAIVYRNYLCTEDEKQELVQQENLALQQENQKKAEHYEGIQSGCNSLEERFQNLGIAKTSERVTREELKENVQETALMVKEKQKNWWKRILQFFKI